MTDLAPQQHQKRTVSLARALKPREVFDWLVTKGYYPEAYVLPPCFAVTKHPKYGTQYFKRAKAYKPRTTELCQVHFPKTDYTDRTFGIVDPELHSDIAFTFARNWQTVLGALFHSSNKVCSYSFPIPIDAKSPGSLGGLRGGRMIYEWIAMAENDIAAIAHRFKFLITTDVKNFGSSGF